MINRRKAKKRAWIFAVTTLSVLLALFVGLYANERINNNGNLNALEQIYTKNFYDLVDNVNNTENRLAKVLSATDIEMQAKYLREVSNNSKLAVASLNNLPYQNDGFQESIKFINQVSGYTETLSRQAEKGEGIDSKDLSVLEEVYDSVLYIKDALAEMSTSMWNGYSIVKESNKFEDNTNAFTKTLRKIKSVDVDYPTMIYDGPFSDSVINKEIKGLKDEIVSVEIAKENLLKIFTKLNADSVEYQGDTVGKFETYNFSCMNQDGKEYLFVQMTKQGGHLLTATSFVDDKAKNLTLDNAKSTALNFCARTGIENAKVVWSDTISGNAYINIAPVENNFILYPDLIKVKIDLASGDVLGYEASGYYTNHIKRVFSSPVISKADIKKFIPSKYQIKDVRLALIPVEYNKEIQTFEVQAYMGGDEYYFYYNTQSGVEENILKVIKTNNGNLLM